MESTNQRDERLWKAAKKRAEFKRHLFTYIIMNLFFWGIWFADSIIDRHFDFPWPVFVTLGWGIGLAFNYIRVYTGFNDSLQESEYQKLISKKTESV